MESANYDLIKLKKHLKRRKTNIIAIYDPLDIFAALAIKKDLFFKAFLLKRQTDKNKIGDLSYRFYLGEKTDYDAKPEKWFLVHRSDLNKN